MAAPTATNTPATQNESGVQKFDIVRLICAFFLPPLGVFLQVGLGKHFWINVVLTLFLFVPGMVHAFYVILTR